MSEDLEQKPVTSNRRMQRFLIYAGVLLAVFLVGFVPMWLKARTATNTLTETEHQLFLVRTQNDLASAVIDARRGDYEPARQAISRFFTSVREDIDKASNSSYTPTQRQALQPLFASRDELITLLARSDPASADRLSDLFVAYRKIMAGQ
jgi:hypothetical protein